MHKFGVYTDSKGRHYPTITLMEREDERFPFSFGVKKAKLILANLEAIQHFVKTCEQQEGGGQ